MYLLRRLIRSFKDWRIGRLPSRLFLRDQVIPSLAQAGRRRLLFVGTRSYNGPAYAQCVAYGLEVWSVDLDPAAATHAAPAGHFVGSICEIDVLARGLTFEAVILNGVLGWGLDTAEESLKALAAIRRVCLPGSPILLGWNPGKSSGAEVAAIREQLPSAALRGVPAAIEFPPKGTAQRYPHRYELFTLG